MAGISVLTTLSVMASPISLQTITIIIKMIEIDNES